MKTTKYTCNICHDEFETDKYIVGIRLDTSQFLTEDAVDKCENHVCVTCLIAIIPISNKYKEKELEN